MSDTCKRAKHLVLWFLYEGAPTQGVNAASDHRAHHKHELATRALINTIESCANSKQHPKDNNNNDDELEPVRSLLIARLPEAVLSKLKTNQPVTFHERIEISDVIRPTARQIRQSILRSVPEDTSSCWVSQYPSKVFESY